MNKLSALAFALVMTVSVNVFAAAEVASLGANTTVNGATFAAGTEGVAVPGTFTYSEGVVVNGVTYPAGTSFQVMQIGNTMVPVATASGGALTGGTLAVAGGIGGGLTTAGVVGSVAVVGGVAAAVSSGNGNATVVTVTQ
jgi:hypothetical protein